MAPAGVAFDPARAMEYARALAQPRQVGTAANDEVIAGLAARLRTFGCRVDIMPVEFSSAGDADLTYFLVAAQILILLTFSAWRLNSWLVAVPAAMLALLLLSSGRLYRLAARASLHPSDPSMASPLRRWWLRRGRAYRTANVVVQLPGGRGATGTRPLLLVAHSDSKSQAMSLPVRMGLVGAASLAAVIFALLSLVRIVAPAVTAIATLTGLTALLIGLPLLFLLIAGSGNASPGAIDNASGVGLVLHLAECLCAAPLARPVTVLITGAEEMGLFGALVYLRDVGVQALRGAAVLNFDGIGTAGQLAWVGGGGPLSAAVRAACRELHIPLAHLPLVGAQFDHLPFAAAGLDALTLVTVGWASFSVHTPRDTAAQLDVQGFRQAGEVALKALESLGG